MFKIQLGISFGQENHRWTNDRPILDLFKYEYLFTLEKLSDYLENRPNFKAKLIDFLKEKCGVKDKIFKIANKNPYKRKKFVLEAKIKSERPSLFYFQVGNSQFENCCLLKFRTNRRFWLCSQNLSFKFTIERVSGDFRIPDKDQSKGEAFAYYRSCVSSDSETFNHPETSNCRYYNHNSVLFSRSCEIKSQGPLRKTGGQRPHKAAAQTSEEKARRGGRANGHQFFPAWAEK